MTTLKTYDAGDDLLMVEELDASGNVIRTARGWISAISNYYPPTSYDVAGHLLSGATSRHMTAAEALAYCQQLLNEQNPAAPAPKPVTFF